MAEKPRWQRTLRRWATWPLAVIVALLAFGLGYLGFHTAVGEGRSVWDVSYLSLQLFTLESGNAAGPSPPLSLEIARLLAPATTGFAICLGLVRWFREEIDHGKMRRRDGHVVVVGLGWLGLALVERLVAQDRAVTAIALDLDDQANASVRRLKVPTIIGDARDVDVLREARVDRASHVVVLAGADETNAETALSIGRLERNRPQVCVAHIRDPQLCAMLRTRVLSGHGTDGFRLEFFNVAEEAAAIMLDHHASFLTGDEPISVGVIGDNDVADAVIAEAARIRRAAGHGPLDIVLAGPREVIGRLAARYTHLTESATIEVVPGPPGSVGAVSVEALDRCGAVFVCLDQDTTAISLSLEVAGRLAPPTIVALGEWTGLASLLAAPNRDRSSVHPFLLHRQVLESDLLLAGIGGRMARAIHQNYVAVRRQEDPPPDPLDPALADWRDLSEEYRVSNRAQAAHIGTKLHAIGCGLAPLDDWDAPPASLTSAEVETLARLEHERFVAERLASGWKASDERGVMQSPYLVSWDTLDDLDDGERVKDIDRRAVAAIPTILMVAGYRLVRSVDLDRGEIDAV